MENKKHKGRVVKVTAVVIGDRLISHKITVIGDDRPPGILANEFLKRQYPSEYNDMADIEGEII